MQLSEFWWTARRLLQLPALWGISLTGGAAQINFNSNTLFSSVCENNPGNTNTGDNVLIGPNARWQDGAGDLRVMITGAIRSSDTDAASVVVGNQSWPSIR